MKATGALAFTLALLMSPGLCPLASASGPPQQGTFTLGVLEFETNPGEQFLTGNILHIRNSIDVSAFSELPWGNALSASETVVRTQLHVTTGVGRATSKTVNIYPDGIIIGTVETTLEGVLQWTYPGPPLTFGPVTFTTGQTFFGFFTSILAVKHGVTGELQGLKTTETATGIVVLHADLTPAGMTVSYATGTYLWLK